MCSRSDDPTQHDLVKENDMGIRLVRFGSALDAADRFAEAAEAADMDMEPGTWDAPEPEPMYYDDETNVEPPLEPLVGGWVHRAVAGTLPTFTPHLGAYAHLPKENA